MSKLMYLFVFSFTHSHFLLSLSHTHSLSLLLFHTHTHTTHRHRHNLSLSLSLSLVLCRHPPWWIVSVSNWTRGINKSNFSAMPQLREKTREEQVLLTEQCVSMYVCVDAGVGGESMYVCLYVHPCVSLFMCVCIYVCLYVEKNTALMVVFSETAIA